MWVVISGIAAVLTTIAFIPQAIKAMQKNTKSVSLLMFIIFTIGISMWAVYGIANHNVAISIANIIGLILSLIILYNKVINLVKGVD